MEVTIEIYGLEVFAYHGVLAEEREKGQPFLFDVTLVAHDAGVRSDKLSDTVDYTEVAECIREIATDVALQPDRGARCGDGRRARLPVRRLSRPGEGP